MKKIILLLLISFMLFGCIQQEGKTVQVVDDISQKTEDSNLTKNESIKLYQFGKFNKGDGFLLEGTPVVLEDVSANDITLKIGTESVVATLDEGSAFFTFNDKDAYKITVDSTKNDSAVFAAAKFIVPKLNTSPRRITVNINDYRLCEGKKVGCCKDSADSTVITCWATKLPRRYQVTAERCFDGTEYSKCSTVSKGYICYGLESDPQLTPACEECGCFENDTCMENGICEPLAVSIETPETPKCEVNSCNSDNQSCIFDYATGSTIWVDCLEDELCDEGIGCYNIYENRAPKYPSEDKLSVKASKDGKVKIDVRTTDPDGDDLQYLIFDQSGYSASNVPMPYEFTLDYRDQTRQTTTVIKSFNILDNQGGSISAPVYIDVTPPKYLDCKEIDAGYCYCNYSKEYKINDSTLEFTGFVPVPGEEGSSTQSFEYLVDGVKSQGKREELKIGIIGSGSFSDKIDEVVEFQIGDEYYVAHLLDEGYDLFKGNLQHAKDNSNWWFSCFVTIEEIAQDKCNSRTYEQRDFKYYVCGDYVQEVSSVEGTGSTYINLAGDSVSCPVLAPEYLSQDCKDLLAQNLTCEEFC